MRWLLLTLTGLLMLEACNSEEVSPMHASYRSGVGRALLVAARFVPLSSPAEHELPTLVSRYGYWQGAQGVLEQYENMQYRPRQFAAGLTLETGATSYGTQVVANPGPYARWDALSLPNTYIVTVQGQPEVVHFTLSRPARVGLIWRAGSFRPGWLGSWSQNGSVQVTRSGSTLTYPVFVKDLPAGQVSLPSVGYPSESGTQNYSVIVGEQGGVAPVVPAVPAGQTVPVPNQSCPAWVHDQYKAQGPDGQWYPTWHPQIDPVYWCYFRHEHGSDPKLAGVDAGGKPLYTPLYGYTAAQDGHSEPHEGFKSQVFRNTDGTWWNVTVHMGSSGLGRVCTRYHTFDLGVTDGQTLKADVHLMGDFGRARYSPATNMVANVTGCKDAAGNLVDQNSIRDMGSRTLGSPNTNGYEPWVVDNEYNVTGFFPNFFSVKQSFPMTRCAVVPSCTSLQDLMALDPVHSGSERFLEYGPTRVVAGDHGQNVGVYYTDPMGAKFVGSSVTGATRQFIASGFRSTLTSPPDPTGYCTARDAWGVEFKCQLRFLTGDKNLEHSLKAPN